MWGKRLIRLCPLSSWGALASALELSIIQSISWRHRDRDRVLKQRKTPAISLSCCISHCAPIVICMRWLPFIRDSHPVVQSAPALEKPESGGRRIKDNDGVLIWHMMQHVLPSQLSYASSRCAHASTCVCRRNTRLFFCCIFHALMADLAAYLTCSHIAPPCMRAYDDATGLQTGSYLCSEWRMLSMIVSYDRWISHVECCTRA